MIDRIIERQNSISFVKSTAVAWALAALLLFLAHILGGVLLSIPAAVGGLLSYYLTPRISPVVVLRMYKGVRLPDHQMPGLHSIVRELSRSAGIDAVPVVWLLPSARSVAFVTGDRYSSALALSHGILHALDDDELVGVMAHELSHIAHNDSRIMWFSEITVKMVTVLSFVGLLMVLINLPAIFSGEQRVSLVLLAVVVAAPLLAVLLQLTLLRTREFAADTGSAELMGSPRPLIRALNKLEGGKRPRFIGWVVGSSEQKGHTLLRTHPSVRERICRLEKLVADEDGSKMDSHAMEQELVERLRSRDRGSDHTVGKQGTERVDP
jgi:heat shock protein HtpX